MVKKRMNAHQKAAAEVYAGGEFSYMTNQMEAADCGDTLFEFVISELGGDGDRIDRATAIQRMKTARNELDEVITELTKGA